MVRPTRGLGPDDEALWRKVTADVTPLVKRRPIEVKPALAAPDPVKPKLVRQPVLQTPERMMIDATLAAKKVSRAPVDTLDGGWDRRLRRGVVAPERTIDLHGHTLATAHAALDHAIDRALADDVRMLLVVTGKPPRADDSGRKRGAIRAAVGDWLAGSRHVSRIAAVRNAHPRHGGAGALYIILRRRRESA